MHPPRPKKAIAHVGFADRLTDWLLTHCPFSALTLLTLVVVGLSLAVPRPALILAPMVGADLVLNLVRRARRVRKDDSPPTMGPQAVA
jgi:hypothetical protein